MCNSLSFHQFKDIYLKIQKLNKPQQGENKTLEISQSNHRKLNVTENHKSSQKK